MTNEERDIISQFIGRVGGGSPQSGFATGSVPATQQALPPIDRDADAFIGQAFTQYPEARYRITQLAFVQEHALVEAQNRIKRLEWELEQTRGALQQAQQAAARPGAAPSGGGGFFSGLFGGGARQQQGGPPPGSGPWNQGGQPQQQGYYPQSAPPPPQYPPNYQQGVFQRQGSGFLGSALTTAAGVAGGVVAGNALMSLFSPHQSSFGGGGFGGGEFGGAAAASPWATPPAPSQDYVDNGSWDQGAAPAANQDYVDNGSWDPPPTPDDSSWTDNSGGGGGGWDSGGGGSSEAARRSGSHLVPGSATKKRRCPKAPPKFREETSKKAVRQRRGLQDGEWRSQSQHASDFCCAAQFFLSAVRRGKKNGGARRHRRSLGRKRPRKQRA
jgi:hypothetical protein